MLFTTNSNDVFSGTYVEEAGEYNVKVLPTTTLTQTKTNGNPMITLNYEVLDGKYQGGQIRYDNQTWVDYDQEAHAQSIKRFNTLLKATGIKDGIKIENMQQLVNLLIGSTMSIKVDWEQGNNGYYNLRVKQHNPVLPSGSKPNGVKAPDSGNSNSSNNGFNTTFNSTYNSPQGNQNSQWGNNQNQGQNGSQDNFGANNDLFSGQPQSVQEQIMNNQDQPINTDGLPFDNPGNQQQNEQIKDVPF